MYGKTQWTNREVKLADMLNKIIIPINFLEKWPPSCLSIQFATIQVIHWKPNQTQDSEHVETPQQVEMSNDIRHWPDHYIQQVSILIAKKTPKLDEEHQLAHKSSFLDRSPGVTSSSDDKAVTSNLRSSPKKSMNCQIVISAHPQQKKIADDLRLNLEKENFEVWVSTDLMSSPTPNGFVSIDYPETPDSMIESSVVSLSTISEITENNSTTPRVTSSTESDEKRPFSKVTENNVLEKSNSFQLSNSKANNLKAQVSRPTSLPLAKNENLYFNYERRQIKRLPSQVSQISVSNNTLTPEKMERLTTFQDKVVNSKLVIILISDAYFRSRTSKVCFLKLILLSI